MKSYRPYLLARLSFDGYDINPKTDKEKVAAFLQIFRSEYCGTWNAHQSDQAILAEYLSGLPGTIDIPFWNHAILELARDMGGLPSDASEAQEDRILENYFPFMAAELLRLRDSLGVVEEARA
tara:strand:+ start:1807 stop:2175 length:369 start_codon:yes stop_codon:yes gene_type:complete